MTRELLLLRHGKSAWNTGAESDFERPLKPRGRRAARRMARWVLGRGKVPERVVSSPARRARQTAKRFCREIGLDPNEIRWEERIYAASVETLLEILGELDAEGSRVMLVGHNPGFEELAAFLGGEFEQWPTMPTAALAMIALPDDWTTLGRGSALGLEIARAREIDGC